MIGDEDPHALLAFEHDGHLVRVIVHVHDLAGEPVVRRRDAPVDQLGGRESHGIIFSGAASPSADQRSRRDGAS